MDIGWRFTGLEDIANIVESILEAAPAKVGYDQPAYVRAEIMLNVSRLAGPVQREWDSLRPDDVVYLLAVKRSDGSTSLTNGHFEQDGLKNSGLLVLRTAEVVQLLDESGRPIREHQFDQVNGNGTRPRIRRLIVHLDSTAFKADTELKSKGRPDIYESINVIVRRSQRENNFKKILETIQQLAVSDMPLPSWLQEVFLGYGDPASATYTRLANRLKAVDFRDTFINWQHLLDSYPGKVRNHAKVLYSLKAKRSPRKLKLIARTSSLKGHHSSLRLRLLRILLLPNPRRSVGETKPSPCSRVKIRSKSPHTDPLPVDPTLVMRQN